jgi:hypothetical protein
MSDSSRDAPRTGKRLLKRVGAGIAALARSAGCSVDQSPLPEVREVAAELREWRQARLAAAVNDRF